jgi:hypothetical protein
VIVLGPTEAGETIRRTFVNEKHPAFNLVEDVLLKNARGHVGGFGADHLDE